LDRRLASAIALTAALTPLAARADEGMWTFDNFPSAVVERTYAFAPDQAWLDRVRLASVRLAGGCSGAFVSPEGLVLTNHHCVAACVQQLSTAQRNYLHTGFLARGRTEERRCPEIELNTLVAIEDVTAQVKKATAGLAGQAFNEAQQAEISRIEKTCRTDGKTRCDVVSLYRGGRFDLYRYRRYQDVRLVFAPEFAVAFFGGDPDNFTFPRYNLDVGFLRAYEDGRPARLRDYLKWNRAGAVEGELVFVSGHPGATQRLLTVAQLEFLRDVALPARIRRLAELRGVLAQFRHQGPEERRIASEDLFNVENALKALTGQFQALTDKDLFSRKVAAENALREAVVTTRRSTDPWEGIATVQQTTRGLYLPYLYLERGYGFDSTLFTIARRLVRGAAERAKPDAQRLSEYREAALPELTQQLFSDAPIHRALEEVKLRFALEKLRENLGADHPLVRQVLSKESPEELARRLVTTTQVGDLSTRRRLWQNPQATEASGDPMIQLARLVDEEARAVRRRYEDEVEAVEKKNGELIARARFETQGTTTYPDATFSLRLSYGTVKGYQENGRPVPSFTTLGGIFERATGQEPYALPERWLIAKDQLNLKTPFNVATTHDIVGGNSGSPVINRRGEAVGLIFDGNLQSLGGAFGYDPSLNRAISVSTAAISETLDKVYDARVLIQELQGG
jgi:hypothetical protein